MLDEQGIDRIDLLKVDVEGAELDVLRGIEARHWPLIRQAVVEVEGWRQNGDAVREVFVSHGFTVRAEQDPVQEAGDLGLVFAVRRRDVCAQPRPGRPFEWSSAALVSRP